MDDEENARLVDFALVPVLSSTTFTTTNVVGPARWQAPEVFLTEEEDDLPFTLKTDVFSFSMFSVEVRFVCAFLLLRMLTSKILTAGYERSPIQPPENRYSGHCGYH